MKILQLVPYYVPYRGGQERYVHNLSKYLAIMGHEVDVITSNYPPMSEHEIVNNIQIYRYKCLFRPLRNPIAPQFFSIGKKIEDYDVVHTHNQHSTAAIAAFLMKKRYTFPLLITCHGQLQFGEGYLDWIVKLYNQTLGKSILSQCDRVAVNSIDDRNFVRSLNPALSDKIELLHNAVDAEYFDFLSCSADAREPGDCIELLYVGRLIKRKGVDSLIRALSRLKKQGLSRNLRCILVGEGENEFDFRQIVRDLGVEDLIEFKGNVTNEELVSLYKSTDIFVLPSLSEVCPTVMLEAMYFGLPVISTNIPGIRDHFSDYALLVPPRDDKSLSDAILVLVNDEKLARKLGSRGERLIKQKYVWSAVSQEYMKVYQDLVMHG